MAKQKLLIPASICSVPPRKFKLDHKSEYYAEDRKYMKQYQMLNFRELYTAYSNIIIFDTKHVVGGVLSDLKHELREDYQSVLFTGKNTVTMRVIDELENESENVNEREALRKLKEHLIGSITLLFTDQDIEQMKKVVESKGVTTGPRIGMKSTHDVYLEGGDTCLEPTKTAFFQALGIKTRINRGQLQIVPDKTLIIRKGQTVGLNEHRLLKLLGIKPFRNTCKALYYFDKKIYCIYPSHMLDHNLDESINEAMNNIGSLTLECNLLNQLSIIIDLKQGIHSLLALQSVTEDKTQMRSIENDDVD